MVDPAKKYAVSDAVALLKNFATTKFDQTVDLCMQLGIDTKKSDQMVRGAMSLPRGIGKAKRVIVFAEGDDAKAARDAGADFVGSDDLVKKIQEGWADFDVAIAVPYMMKHVGKLGKILGPQGKMPSPKSGTVTEEVKTAVHEFKAGKIEYRADASGNVQVPAGMLSFSVQDIEENIRAFIEHVVATKPASAKGTFVRGVSISATMSPGIRLAI
jgi:large subunit ribosomal protein L1